MEISEIVTEEVEKMCEAFCDAEPAVCVLLRQLGVADNDVQEVLFGTDSSTYGRCLAEGHECVETDAAYAAAIALARRRALARWIREALAILKIPHCELSEEMQTTFCMELEGCSVHMVVDDCVSVWSFTQPVLPESSEVRRFVHEANTKYATLGRFTIKGGCLAYYLRPHLPTMLEYAEDEVSTAAIYGARVLRVVSPAIELLRTGVATSMAVQLIPATLPER